MRDGQKRDLARVLRRSCTDAERAIWRLLRDRRLAGLKFRRQVPVGPFVADFACLSRRLIVELDGGQHLESASDERRDAFLREAGWLVVRVWNNDALKNPDGVLWRVAIAAGIDLDALPDAGD